MQRSSASGPLGAVDFALELNQKINSGSEPDAIAGCTFTKPFLEDARPFSLPSGPLERLVPISEPASIGAELLRTFVSRLLRGQQRHSLKKLLITSPVPEEGKTLLTANLSLTLALHHQRVLIVDGDLRRCRLSRWFDIADDWLVRDSDEGVGIQLPPLRKAEGLPLWVLPTGTPASAPGAVLQSAKFAEALAVMAVDFDWIVMDSPPVIPFGDAGTLATLADGVILVTRCGVTPKAALAEALKSLELNKIIATILNDAKVSAHRYYYEYYKVKALQSADLDPALPPRSGPRD